jgi:hypothetical protein
MFGFNWNTRGKDYIDHLASPLPSPIEIAQREELRRILLDITPESDRTGLTAATLRLDSDALELIIEAERVVVAERLATYKQRIARLGELRRLPLSELRRMQQQHYG